MYALWIKRRTQVDVSTLDFDALHLTHSSEITLGLYLAQFHETLQQMTRELMPSRLTYYLYSLAEKFNGFFCDCRVENDRDQNSRLLLCEGTHRVLRTRYYL